MSLVRKVAAREDCRFPSFSCRYNLFLRFHLPIFPHAPYHTTPVDNTTSGRRSPPFVKRHSPTSSIGALRPGPHLNATKITPSLPSPCLRFRIGLMEIEYHATAWTNAVESFITLKSTAAGRKNTGQLDATKPEDENQLLLLLSIIDLPANLPESGNHWGKLV